MLNKFSYPQILGGFLHFVASTICFRLFACLVACEYRLDDLFDLSFSSFQLPRVNYSCQNRNDDLVNHSNSFRGKKSLGGSSGVTQRPRQQNLTSKYCERVDNCIAKLPKSFIGNAGRARL